MTADRGVLRRAEDFLDYPMGRFTRADGEVAL
jgi:hypothetical protein